MLSNIRLTNLPYVCLDVAVEAAFSRAGVSLERLVYTPEASATMLVTTVVTGALLSKGMQQLWGALRPPTAAAPQANALFSSAKLPLSLLESTQHAAVGTVAWASVAALRGRTYRFNTGFEAAAAGLCGSMLALGALVGFNLLLFLMIPMASLRYAAEAARREPPVLHAAASDALAVYPANRLADRAHLVAAAALHSDAAIPGLVDEVSHSILQRLDLSSLAATVCVSRQLRDLGRPYMPPLLQGHVVSQPLLRGEDYAYSTTLLHHQDTLIYILSDGFEVRDAPSGELRRKIAASVRRSSVVVVGDHLCGLSRRGELFSWDIHRGTSQFLATTRQPKFILNATPHLLLANQEPASGLDLRLVRPTDGQVMYNFAPPPEFTVGRVHLLAYAQDTLAVATDENILLWPRATAVPRLTIAWPANSRPSHLDKLMLTEDHLMHYQEHSGGDQLTTWRLEDGVELYTRRLEPCEKFFTYNNTVFVSGPYDNKEFPSIEKHPGPLTVRALATGRVAYTLPSVGQLPTTEALQLLAHMGRQVARFWGQQITDDDPILRLNWCARLTLAVAVARHGLLAQAAVLASAADDNSLYTFDCLGVTRRWSTTRLNNDGAS